MAPRSVSLLLVLLLAVGSGCAHQTAQRAAPPADQPSRNPSPYLRMMLARQAENQGDLKGALTLYSTLDDPYALYATARIFYTQNDFDKALATVERILNTGSYIEEALDLRMRIYTRTERWQEAITDAERLLKRYPENKNLRMHLARLKLFTADYKGARKALQAQPIENDDYESLYLLSKACLGERDQLCAQRALENAIEGGADYDPIFLDLGKIYEQQGRNADAEETYRKLLEIDPESKEGLGALIDLYIATGRNQDAIDGLKALLEIYPRKEILQKLVILELDNKMFAEARELLQGQKTLSNEDSYYLAIANAGLKRWDEALHALEKVPREGELGCDVGVLKASILEDMGRADEALAELKATWDTYAPDDACKEAGYRLATALEDRGRRAEGLAVAMRLLDKDPQDAMMLNFIGYIWADEGRNLDQARRMIAEALKQRPDDGYILDSMGWVLFKLGRPGEAARYIRRALSKYGDDPIINTHMGDVLMALREPQQALDFYLKAKVNTKKTDADLERKIERIIANAKKERVRP